LRFGCKWNMSNPTASHRKQRILPPVGLLAATLPAMMCPNPWSTAAVLPLIVVSLPQVRRKPAAVENSRW
jgi:hypothetical protein